MDGLGVFQRPPLHPGGRAAVPVLLDPVFGPSHVCPFESPRPGPRWCGGAEAVAPDLVGQQQLHPLDVLLALRLEVAPERLERRVALGVGQVLVVPPDRVELPAQSLDWTGIRFAWALGFLGTVTVTTPLAVVAVTPPASASAGSGTAR